MITPVDLVVMTTSGHLVNIWLPALVEAKSRYTILVWTDVDIVADTLATDFRREDVTVSGSRGDVPTFPDHCGTQVS